MTIRLSVAAKQFWLKNTTGVTDTTPAGQLQRTYMVKYIQANETGLSAGAKAVVQAQPFDELEIRWLKAWIKKNLGTPPANTFQSSHWAKAVEVLGLTPSKRQTANMLTFYLNASA